MADEILDVKGLTCPRPLVETCKKIKKMEVGQTLEVIGDHAPSEIEVPEAMSDMGHEVISHSSENGIWYVNIKKK